MGFRQNVKNIESIVARAKPGENVTTEEYELMVATLKMAKDMQKLRCGVLVISNAVILSVLAGFAVKYGYDLDLGEKIQTYTLPINAVGLLAEWQLVEKLRKTKKNADTKINQLRQINLNKMFR